MKKPEQLVWSALQRRMVGEWIAQRHEDRYSPGIPDVSFVRNGVSGWIELKHADKNEPLKIRPGQLNWMKSRVDAGCMCILMTRRDSIWTGVLVDSESVEKMFNAVVDFDFTCLIGISHADPKEIIDHFLNGGKNDCKIRKV